MNKILYRFGATIFYFLSKEPLVKMRKKDVEIAVKGFGKWCKNGH